MGKQDEALAVGFALVSAVGNIVQANTITTLEGQLTNERLGHSAAREAYRQERVLRQDAERHVCEIQDDNANLRNEKTQLLRDKSQLTNQLATEHSMRLAAEAHHRTSNERNEQLEAENRELRAQLEAARRT